MAKKISVPAQLVSDDIQSTASRACIDYLKEIQSLGVTPEPDGLELILSCMNPKYKSAFLGHLEIFLQEAVRNMDVQACYDRGKAAQEKARMRLSARLARRKAA